MIEPVNEDAPIVARTETQPTVYGQLFHHEGAFEDGAQIQKASFLGAGERFLIVQEEDIEALTPDYDSAVEKYEGVLPQVETFPNGMSRQQAAKILAAAETIISFNGGLPNEHTSNRNTLVYVKGAKEQENLAEGNARISEFKGQQAMMCNEMAAITQQFLSPTEEMTYVSGSADLNDNGSYENHSFNLIKPTDTKYPMAILDIANPVQTRQADGTFVLTQYCAPLTQEQFKQFKDGETIRVEYKGEIRHYSYSIAGFIKSSW